MQQILAQAAAALARGQVLEDQATPVGLAGAVRCYDEALALLRSLPADDETVRREQARASMNRGNALQRQPSSALQAEAVRAYDEAIALLGTPPADAPDGDRNMLAAAWMNRGLALYSRTDSAGQTEAAHSLHEAIALLGPLPPDASRDLRINLAAAWLNLANVLLGPDDFGPARAAARESAALATPDDDTDPTLADIALKARRAECAAILGLLFSLPPRSPSIASLAGEGSDLVDEGLALARRWESRGVPVFRPIAARLFRQGLEFYRWSLPNFLAEFVLEHLDPERSPGAMIMVDDSLVAARQALTAARSDLENHRTIYLDTPETTRLLQRLHDLRAAEQRLAELRPEPPGQ